MRRVVLLSLAAVSALLANGEVLHTCRDICMHLANGRGTDDGFDIVATVLVGSNPKSVQLIAVADDSGATLIDLADLRRAGHLPDLNPGERYHMTGHFSVADHDALARVDRLTACGCGATCTIPSVSGIELTEGKCSFTAVRLTGRILDVFADEVDPEWAYLVLNANGCRVYAFFARNVLGFAAAERLVDSTVEITGMCNMIKRGARQMLGPYLIINRTADVLILHSPPADAFEVPFLEDVRGLSASVVEGFGRRRVIGTVLAVSHAQSFILATDDGRVVNVNPLQNPPACGSHVEVCGRVSTDVYHINLHRPVWRNSPGQPLVPPTQDIPAIDLLTDTNRNPMIKAEFHGKPLRLTGVIRSLPAEGGREHRLHVESDGILVPVDPGQVEDPFAELERGYRITVSGVCCMEVSHNSRLDTFPRIETFSLILRNPTDITVLDRPSWWTTGRLMALVGTLLAMLVGFCIWNIILNRLVERRSRELLRARVSRDEAQLKTEERMRLAVELHDTIAQEMTGVAMQIDAAELAAENDLTRLGGYLASARQRLRSCRENLRNCLWDLRNRPFETRLFADAVRRTISPYLGNTKLSVMSDLTCHEFSDNAIHAVLCVLREISINAIRHGQASLITISAERTADGIDFCVVDNGVGFDPLNRPGPAQGHFGLQGAMERINRLNGTFHIDSAPGQGTIATITHLDPET